MKIESAEDDDGSDVFEALDSARGSLDQFSEEFQNAGIFDRPDHSDNQAFSEYKRGKIDREYQGTRGFINSGFGALGLQPSYQGEMNALNDAQNYAQAGDIKFGADSDRQKAQQQQLQQLQQLRTQMDTAAADVNKPDYQRQREAVDSSYRQQLDAAGNIANNKTLLSGVFKNQAEANAYANQLTHDASVIHDSQLDQLARGRYDVMQTGKDRLDVLKRLGAGDKEGAAKAELEASLNAEERKIDPKDTEQIKQFENISTQALANFDADATRKGKYQEAQTDDQIQSYQEEAKEAQLTAAGRPDDARTSALQFSTQHRVKSLQEAADAEGDPIRKSQLQREVAAADSAGKIERDALQQELHRTQMSNTQAPALSAASQVGHLGVGGSHEGGTSDFGDAAGKLADAAMKLDKALSRSKTLVLVKD